jgi:hypothetical protein
MSVIRFSLKCLVGHINCSCSNVGSKRRVLGPHRPFDLNDVPYGSPTAPRLSLIGLLLASEFKHSIQDSATYQILFPRSNISDCEQAYTTELDASAKTSHLRVYLIIRRICIDFREMCSFPLHGRGGIR